MRQRTTKSMPRLVLIFALSAPFMPGATARELNSVPDTWEGRLDIGQAERPTQAEKKAAASDDSIAQCVNKKVAASGSLKGQAITVSVSNGEASLIGSVRSESHKRSAAKIAKQCGAKTVNNALAVDPAAEAKERKPAGGEKKPTKP